MSIKYNEKIEELVFSNAVYRNQIAQIENELREIKLGENSEGKRKGNFERYTYSRQSSTLIVANERGMGTRMEPKKIQELNTLLIEGTRRQSDKFRSIIDNLKMNINEGKKESEGFIDKFDEIMERLSGAEEDFTKIDGICSTLETLLKS